ncbi:MAG: RHS repeat-associated core domain-containing protein [Clostridia bacterium]|nr:RHS repeat-associated core domain-containing protein [Clostridia bacterium]
MCRRHYLRNRFYNPHIGRFTTVDPIRSGHNWYAYCSNNPLMFVDPLGLNDYIALSDNAEALGGSVY